eukprot:2201452-Rhodomonas_salina.1
MAHGYGAVPALTFVEQHSKRVSGLVLLTPDTIFPSLGRNGISRALALKMCFPYMVRYVGPVLALMMGDSLPRLGQRARCSLLLLLLLVVVLQHPLQQKDHLICKVSGTEYLSEP